MFADLLGERAKPIANLSASQLGVLERHYELMFRWNKVLNLTRIADPVEAVERHYVESLFLSAQVPEGKLRIADIGSGAGFPGVVVAACFKAARHSDFRSANRESAIRLKADWA